MTDNPEEAASQGQSYEGYVIEAENAAEMARLMLQDRLLTQVMGGTLPEQEDLSGITQVLDVACGPGGWLLDLAAHHPHVQGVGIDISQLMIEYANGQARRESLSNVQFHVMDATKLLPFPDNSFDLINGRILTGFLTTPQWSTLLQECYRIIRPGGILRLTEAEWGFTNSITFDKLCSFISASLYRADHTFSPRGRTIGNANVLRLLLRRAGYEGIKYRSHAVDYSAGTELHESNCQNMLVVFKLLQPFHIKMQLATQEELDYLYQQMEEDMQQEEFCAVDYFLTVWGHKNI